MSDSVVFKGKSELEEAVDCLYRKWWLQKSSIRRVLFSIFAYIFAILALFLYTSNKQNGLLVTSIAAMILPVLTWYQYSLGFKNKLRKSFIEQFGADSFPAELEVIFSNEGIQFSQLGVEQKIKWDLIQDIREHKDQYEFYGKAVLIQIKQDKLPEIDKVKSMWQEATL